MHERFDTAETIVSGGLAGAGGERMFPQHRGLKIDLSDGGSAIAGCWAYKPLDAAPATGSRITMCAAHTCEAG